MDDTCYVSGIIFGKTENMIKFYNYYNEKLSFNNYWEFIVLSTELIEDSDTTSKLYITGFADTSAKVSLLEELESYESMRELCKKFCIHMELYSENNKAYFQEYIYINNLGYLEYKVVDYVVLPLYLFDDEDKWYSSIKSPVSLIEKSDYLLNALKEIAEDNDIEVNWSEKSNSKNIENVLRNIFRYSKKNDNDYCYIGGCPENIPYKYEEYTEDAV